MPYTTPPDLRRILARDMTQIGPQGTGTGTAADLSDAQLQDAIDSAESYVDGALSARYSVPFSAPVPRLVVQVTKALAAYYADTINRQSVDMNDGDPVLRRFQWADSALTRLAGGQLDLPEVQARDVQKRGDVALPAYGGHLFDTEDFGIGRDDRWPRRTLDSGRW